MSSARDVQGAVKEDPVLAEALARGIVNLRALARWLIRTKRWETTETAVLSGLRRYLADPRPSPFANASGVLASARVHTRAGMCVALVPRSSASQERLGVLCRSFDYARGEVLRILEADPVLMLLVDQDQLPKVERAFGPGGLLDVQRGLTEVAVVAPHDSTRTPGILALLTNTLALEGINVVHGVTAGRRNVFLVADEDAIRAYRALSRFAGPGPGPGAGRGGRSGSDSARGPGSGGGSGPVRR